MDQDLQIHLLVPDRVALCNYDLLNNLCLRHIVSVMTIVVVQLTDLTAIFKMETKSKFPLL